MKIGALNGYSIERLNVEFTSGYRAVITGHRGHTSVDFNASIVYQFLTLRITSFRFLKLRLGLYTYFQFPDEYGCRLKIYAHHCFYPLNFYDGLQPSFSKRSQMMLF